MHTDSFGAAVWNADEWWVEGLHLAPGAGSDDGNDALHRESADLEMG